jgi:MFS family permease
MGLLGESYLLFSVGTLRPVWEVLFPACFLGSADDARGDDYDEDETCGDFLLSSLTHSVVAGVIAGMLLLGWAASRTGRRLGSILTASLMASGAAGMAALPLFSAQLPSGSLRATPATLFRRLSWCLALFGVGVGGEYPLAASSASERAMGAMRLRREEEEEEEEKKRRQRQRNADAAADATGEVELSAPPPPTSSAVMSEEEEEEPDGIMRGAPARAAGEEKRRRSSRTTAGSVRQQQQQNRGRRVQLVFTMQGVGILLNSILVTVSLWITGQRGGEPYDEAVLLRIWQATYALGALVLVLVLIGRVFLLKESAAWLRDRQVRQEEEKRACAIERIGRGGGEAAEAGGSCSGGNKPQQSPGSSPATAKRFDDDDAAIDCARTVSSLSIPSVTADNISIWQHKEYDYHSNHDDDDRDATDELQLREAPSTDPEADLKSTVYQLLLRNYGVRLLGVSLAWFLWDVSFYGNKLFQSTFLLALTGDETTLFEFGVAATLNSAVALAGYLGAAALVDRPWVGRKRLQLAGFLLTGTLFVGVGFFFEQLASAVLVAMYLGSSFFGQLGPNATTFLLPAEIFPTEMRTFCHGVAAASGKLGALVASITFHFLRNDLDMFLISGYCSFLACAVTFWTIPETTGLDLYENDRKWRLIVAGRKGEYEGPANHPKFLSTYERHKLAAKRQQETGSYLRHDDVHD